MTPTTNPLLMALLRIFDLAEDRPDIRAFVTAAILSSQIASRETARLRDVLEDMVRQFAYWSDLAGGIATGGLSTLEDAFDVLGWVNPHPLPDRCCDEPGCTKDGTMGWPGPSGVYRRTCWDHSYHAALSEPKP